MEKMNIFFPEETMEELKKLAKQKGTSISGLVRMIVMEYLFDLKNS